MQPAAQCFVSRAGQCEATDDVSELAALFVDALAGQTTSGLQLRRIGRHRMMIAGMEITNSGPNTIYYESTQGTVAALLQTLFGITFLSCNRSVNRH